MLNALSASSKAYIAEANATCPSQSIALSARPKLQTYPRLRYRVALTSLTLSVRSPLPWSEKVLLAIPG